MMKGIVEITEPLYKSGNIICKDITFSTNFSKFKVFHNDLVEYNSDNNIMTVISTNIKEINITGVLKLKERTIYGITKKGLQLCLFEPLDWKYPNFLVATKLKGKVNAEHYAVIEYSRWEKTLPRGSIKKMIGPVGNIKCEYEMLLHKYNLNGKPPKLFKHIKKDNIWDLISQNELVNYNDIRKTHIISIDPEGSKDIDDALSIRTCDEGRYCVGIHIADVTFWLDKYNINPTNTSSIYAPHKKINMLPDIIADNLASLKPKKDRLTLTLWISLDDDCNIINYKYENCIIRSSRAYTYEEFERECVVSEASLMLMDVSKKIGKNYGYNTELWDVHKMVEVYMVMANNLTGMHIKNKNGIFRTHNSTQITDVKIDDKRVEDFVRIFQSNSAQYVIEKENNTTEAYYHYGLKLDYYTHFTSPIRRYIDIIIHKIIKSNENTGTFPSGDNNIMWCERSNEMNKRIKKFDRDIREVELLSNLNDGVHKETAYIIGFAKNNKIIIYFPNWNYCNKILPISVKLQHMIEYEVIDDISMSVKNNAKEIICTLHLYDKITVEMNCFMERHRKRLVMKIVDPDLSSLVE